jgi:hypothetical protein
VQAKRYEQERLRCSACQEIFVAEVVPELGEKKYSADAQVMLSLSRYFLGVPFYRLEQFQSMLGMPIADATQFDQTEQVWKALQPVVGEMRYEAAQSELIYQDDTRVRILSLLKENEQASADARVGMYTTALVACQGDRRIVLYVSGRSHAGENLAELLIQRESARPAPLIMSDALAANQSGDLPEHIRCLCLAHGYRKFSDIESHYPGQTQRVLEDLDSVFDVDRYARESVLDDAQRLELHQRYSAPVLERLETWLEQQLNERLVEPKSSLGKAMNYLLNNWAGLTQFLTTPGAPLNSNYVERMLKLMIRQRRNSLFFASEHGAEVASEINSVIATCAENGINALNYLVNVVDNAAAVAADPKRWLPWSDQAT